MCNGSSFRPIVSICRKGQGLTAMYYTVWFFPIFFFLFRKSVWYLLWLFCYKSFEIKQKNSGKIILCNTLQSALSTNRHNWSSSSINRVQCSVAAAAAAHATPRRRYKARWTPAQGSRPGKPLGGARSAAWYKFELSAGHTPQTCTAAFDTEIFSPLKHDIHLCDSIYIRQ